MLSILSLPIYSSLSSHLRLFHPKGICFSVETYEERKYIYKALWIGESFMIYQPMLIGVYNFVLFNTLWRYRVWTTYFCQQAGSAHWNPKILHYIVGFFPWKASLHCCLCHVKFNLYSYILAINIKYSFNNNTNYSADRQQENVSIC